MLALSFSERWRQYTMLALAAGSIREANAQVVYTDIDPDFLISGPVEGALYDALQLDFNADASPEGSFVFSRFTFNGSCYTAGSMSFALLNSASVLLDSSGYILKLAEGNSIDAAGNWNSSFFHSFFRSDFFIDTCDGDIEYPALSGPWQQENNTFMGMRFTDAGGELHYGWVRLSVKVQSAEGAALLNAIRIGDFEFESSPDTGILAGDKGPPVSLNAEHISTLKVTPNPTTDFLYLSGAQNTPIEKYIIYNQMGVLVGSGMATQSIIDVTQLTSGLYYLQLLVKEAPVQQFSFIKQ